MSNAPPSKLPPEELRKMLNGALLTRNAELTQQVAELTVRCEALTKQVEDLTRERDKNSSNSSKPPSSDNLGDRRSIRKKKKRSGKKRGGQPGHKGHSRKMLAPEDVDQIINSFPDYCEVCQQVPPQQALAEPWVHQVVELLANGGGRHVIEYRCYGVTCTCGADVAAPTDKVPSPSFGPQLSSTVCALTGNFQLSRRQVVIVLKEGGLSPRSPARRPTRCLADVAFRAGARFVEHVR